MKRSIRPEGADKEKVETASKNEFFEALTGVSVTKENGQKKDKMITLTPTERLKKMVDEIVAFKKAEKQAKAERESREVDVIAFAKEKQDEDGFRKPSNFQKSYRIQGNKELITFVSNDSFSAIGEADKKALEAILGQSFSTFIEKKMIVSLNEIVTLDETLQKELVEMFRHKYGDSWLEKFKVFFTSETKYLTVDGFDRKIFDLSPKVVEKIREHVSQKKPSLK